MMHASKAIYVPALRMKAGELNALGHIAEDVKRMTLPHFIVPPRSERDDELQKALVGPDIVPGAGIILARYWRGRSALIDPRFLFADFGEERASLWLPKLYDIARREGVTAIPVASIDELSGARAQAFKTAIDPASLIQLAIRIGSDALASGDLTDRLKLALDTINCAPERVVAIADFADSDFSRPELVADIIEGAIEFLEAAAPWHSIVFEGTSYPEVNPAEHGQDILVPRNEWKAWKAAVRLSKSTRDQLIFGDYGADCAKMAFGDSGGRAIRHYRYATPEAWLVTRGEKEGRDGTLMRDVCQRILKSGHFAGQAFSFADNYMYGTAKGTCGPGNSTTWREMNTAHHITRVVRDIGAIKGITFKDLAVVPDTQMAMFE